jgi:hypothetical protein
MIQHYATTTMLYGSSNTHISGTVFTVILVILIPIIILEVVGMWKVFQKAGRPGWAAIIPLYNYWVLFEIAGKPGWWVFGFLASIIPLIGWILPVVLEIIAVLEIAKRFSKSSVFAIFGLFLFGFIGFPMLGFGDAKYQVPPAQPSPQGPTPVS